MLLLHLFLFLLLTSHSLSQTDVTNITTTSSSAEDLDEESIDGNTMKIEVEKLNEEKEVKQEDEEDDDKHIEEEEKEDDLKELNSEVTTPESESDEISTVKEFETSRSLLSAAWKELGDAEVEADEVKRRIA